ncbi:hypothetical protein ACU4GR_20370 [Methylobacterium oryzae CBMB20]
MTSVAIEVGDPAHGRRDFGHEPVLDHRAPVRPLLVPLSLSSARDPVPGCDGARMGQARPAALR